ncbi:MAG: 3'-5' exonuclease domain-containing protein 2 [Bacteroidales bacterium]|nr:3'-5' exonuclease domain-containing protein 2 [Bacteroidales bacterium]
MKNSLFKVKITREELNLLPRKKFEGEIIFVDSFHKYHKVLPEIERETIFGFDTETRPSFRKGNMNKVSLLQLSTGVKAFIFRVNKIGLPDSLMKILANDDIIKTGVAIKDDLAGLKKLSHFNPGGFIELQEHVKNYGIEDQGLKKLTGNILGFRISKRQQTSNWEADTLTVAQIEYAATDAWVCYQIYSVLQKTKRINGYEGKGSSEIG